VRGIAACLYPVGGLVELEHSDVCPAALLIVPAQFCCGHALDYFHDHVDADSVVPDKLCVQGQGASVHAHPLLREQICFGARVPAADGHVVHSGLPDQDYVQDQVVVAQAKPLLRDHVLVEDEIAATHAHLPAPVDLVLPSRSQTCDAPSPKEK
jgi:hypothetical protein